MSTVIGLNDPKTRKVWSTNLVVAISKDSYWQSKYMGRGEETVQPVMLLTDLERDAGDTIKYDLSLQLGGAPKEGDEKVEGTGDELQFASDQVSINQQRKAVSCGGRMTRKRTVHDLRLVGRARLKEYWTRLYDEDFFMYASAGRGVNSGFIQPVTYTGRASNSFQAPDAAHLLFGDGTSKATLTAAGLMSRTIIERANTKADTLGGGTDSVAELQPTMVNGNPVRVMVMHPAQAHALKVTTGEGGWLDITKSIAMAEGRESPLIRGGLGMIGNTVLHSHKSVVRYSDYGAGANVNAARALYLGRQALVCAHGSAGNGLRMSWFEHLTDAGNNLEIIVSSMHGIKKNQFDGKDFGMFSVDTAIDAALLT